MTDGATSAAGSLGVVERVAALHRVRLFAGIPGRVLAAVAEVAVEAHLYVIVEGRVRVHRGGRTVRQQ